MITVTEKPRRTCHPQSGLVNIQGRFPDSRVYAFPAFPMHVRISGVSGQLAANSCGGSSGIEFISNQIPF